MLTDEVICLDMKKIEDLKWKDFRLLDLFTYQKGNQKNMNALSDGETPLVSAKKIDNGYKGFYRVNENDIFRGNCITLNNDGDGGAGLSFYQPSLFALDTHVTALYPIEEMSKNIMLFIACCISKQSVLFGHGHSINTSRLNYLTIMLPCDSSGKKPNYAFMEEYMKQIEKKLLTRYKNYLEYMKFSKYKYSREIAQMGEIKIDDMFRILPGVRLTKQDQVSGNKPFVGSTDSNNGITSFCGNTNSSEDENILGVNYNGSVVENFYHPYKALFSDDVKRFHLKQIQGNKYVYLYLKNCILKQQVKYQYGYKFNEQRMKEQVIMVPMTNDGNPDYEHMENYMHNIENRLLKRYIEQRLKTLTTE